MSAYVRCPMCYAEDGMDIDTGSCDECNRSVGSVIDELESTRVKLLRAMRVLKFGKESRDPFIVQVSAEALNEIGADDGEG